MSKRNAPQRKKVAQARRHQKRIVFAVVLILGLSLISSALAQWSGLKSVPVLRAMVQPPAPTPSASPFAPANPSKEYIYAGGRLVATEEPTPGATATPSPSPAASPSPSPAPALETWRSLSLDGTNSYLEASSPANTSLDIRGPLTLEAWVKTSADMTYPSYRNIVVRGDAWNQGVTSYTLRLADGKIRFDLFQASGSYTGIYSNTVMSTGAWHHIAAVYDGSQMRIYLDGQLDCSQAFTWTPPAFSTIFRIGRETNYNFPYNYSGLVDEVRVSSGALYTSNFSPQATLSVETTTKGLWKFDEQTANDATNSNNGTLYGAGATYSTDVPTAPSTPSDNSLWLDGTNSYLEASSPAGSSLDIRGPFTLEAWVKNSADTTYPNYRSILVRGDNWNLGVSSFLFRLSDGKLRFDMYQASGSYTGFYSNTVMSTGVWHHVAAVYDGSQMKIYLDGQLDGLQSFTWDPPVISTIFRVGRETNINFPFSYSGLIDEVRVSSGVLYTSNFTPQKHLTSQASTKGLWKFDGQTANDSSGNGNGGTLNGNATYSTDAPTP